MAEDVVVEVRLGQSAVEGVAPAFCSPALEDELAWPRLPAKKGDRLLVGRGWRGREVLVKPEARQVASHCKRPAHAEGGARDEGGHTDGQQGPPSQQPDDAAACQEPKADLGDRVSLNSAFWSVKRFAKTMPPNPRSAGRSRPLHDDRRGG